MATILIGAASTLLLARLAVPSTSGAEVVAMLGGPAPSCQGDCNDDGEVDVTDVVHLVRHRLSLSDAFACDSADTNGSDTIDGEEVLAAVDLALGGCANPFEPDNSPEQARLIGCERRVGGAIPAGDTDWFRFRVDELSATVLETLGMSGDSRLRLYDSSGVLIDHDDDSGIGYFSRVERICGANALPPGEYVAEVSAFGEADAIDAYGLVLHCLACGLPNWTPTPTVPVEPATPTVTETPTLPPLAEDGYEYDDVFAHAHPIGCGEVQRRTLSFYGDVDTIRLDLPARSSLAVYVRSLRNSYSTTSVALFGPTGEFIGDGAYEIRRTCATAGLTAGTYQLRLSGPPDEYEIGVGCGTCEASTATPTTAATATRTPSPAGGVTPPSISPTRTRTPSSTRTPGAVADAYEPDNSVESAKPIACGSDQSHTLTSGDVDFVRISLEQTTGLLFQSEGYANLTLYNSDGGVVDSPFYIIDRRCGFDALAPGTYYVSVTGYPPNYRISALCRPCSGPNPTASASPTPTRPPATLPPDPYEPDNSRQSAKRIKCGETQHRTFHNVNDVDRLRLTLDEPSALVIRASPYASVRLIDPLGYEDYGSGTLSRDCSYDPAPAGEYDLTLGIDYEPGRYDVEVRCVPCGGQTATPSPTRTPFRSPTRTPTTAADAFEPDDSRESARSIACGETVAQSLAPINDVDWRTFTIPALSTVAIDVISDNLPGPVDVTLSDSEQNVLLNLAHYGQTTRLRRSCGTDALEAGTYFLTLNSSYISFNAPYVLRLRCLPCDAPNPSQTPTITRTPTLVPTSTMTPTSTQGPDAYEPDDQAGSPSEIGCGQSQMRSLLPLEDQDWVAFSLDGATRILFETAGTPGGDTQLAVLDSNQTVVAADDDSGPGAYSRLLANLEPGAYLARIRSSSGVIASYQLRLTCLPPATPGVDPICGDGETQPGEDCDDGGTLGGDGCAANCTFEQDVLFSLGNEATTQSGATLQTGLFALHLSIQGSLLLTLGEPRDDVVVDSRAEPIYRAGDVPITLLLERNAGRIDPVIVPGLICACVRFVELRTCNGEPPEPGSPEFCSGNPSACDGADCVATHGEGVCGDGVLGCAGVSQPDYLYTVDSLDGRFTFERLPGEASSGALMNVAIAIGTIMDSGTCSQDDTDPRKGPDGVPCSDDDPVESRGYASLQFQTTGRAEGRVLNVNNSIGKDIAATSRCGVSPCLTTATGNMVECDQILAGNPAGMCLASTFPSLDQPTTGDIVVPVTFCAVP